MRAIRRELACWALITLAVACGGEAPPQDREENPRQPAVSGAAVLSIFTVNYPLQYLAERIGGDLVSVELPVPAAEDPAYWRPSAEQIADYQSADLILLNGAGYAEWLSLAALPQSKLVDTSAAFRDRYIPLEEGPVHSHGPEGEHSHRGFAFTTWLDPTLAIEQARVVLSAFVTARPEHRQAFEGRYDELERDLMELDSALKAATSRLLDVPVLFSHPVYQYLIRRYDLDAESVHLEPGEAPTEEQWSQLDELLARRSSRWMVWEDEPLPETVAQLAQRGLETVVFRPGANRPVRGDYLSIMNENVAQLQRIGGRTSDAGALASGAESATSNGGE